MAKLPKERTRLRGAERFDVELNTFLRSCGLAIFDYGHPVEHWCFGDSATSPFRIDRAFRAALRLAVIDGDTGTDPLRPKLDDALTALASVNSRSPEIRHRLRTYEAAREAEWEAEQAARYRAIHGDPDDI